MRSNRAMHIVNLTEVQHKPLPLIVTIALLDVGQQMRLMITRMTEDGANGNQDVDKKWQNNNQHVVGVGHW